MEESIITLEMLLKNPKNLSKLLYNKYGDISEDYMLLNLESLIYSKNCHLFVTYKEYLIWDYIDEFLKRYYYVDEAFERLPKISDYYKNYSKFFCKPLFKDFKKNQLIQTHGEQKAELYYKINYGKDKKNNKSNKADENINSNSDSLESCQTKTMPTKKTVGTLFSMTVRENIDERIITQSTVKDEESMYKRLNKDDDPNYITLEGLDNENNFPQKSDLLTKRGNDNSIVNLLHSMGEDIFVIKNRRINEKNSNNGKHTLNNYRRLVSGYEKKITASTVDKTNRDEFKNGGEKTSTVSGTYSKLKETINFSIATGATENYKSFKRNADLNFIKSNTNTLNDIEVTNGRGSHLNLNLMSESPKKVEKLLYNTTTQTNGTTPNNISNGISNKMTYSKVYKINSHTGESMDTNSNINFLQNSVNLNTTCNRRINSLSINSNIGTGGLNLNLNINVNNPNVNSQLNQFNQLIPSLQKGQPVLPGQFLSPSSTSKTQSIFNGKLCDMSGKENPLLVSSPKMKDAKPKYKKVINEFRKDKPKGIMSGNSSVQPSQRFPSTRRNVNDAASISKPSPKNSMNFSIENKMPIKSLKSNPTPTTLNKLNYKKMSSIGNISSNNKISTSKSPMSTSTNFNKKNLNYNTTHSIASNANKSHSKEQMSHHSLTGILSGTSRNIIRTQNQIGVAQNQQNSISISSQRNAGIYNNYLHLSNKLVNSCQNLNDLHTFQSHRKSQSIAEDLNGNQNIKNMKLSNTLNPSKNQMTFNFNSRNKSPNLYKLPNSSTNQMISEKTFRPKYDSQEKVDIKIENKFDKYDKYDAHTQDAKKSFRNDMTKTFGSTNLNFKSQSKSPMLKSFKIDKEKETVRGVNTILNGLNEGLTTKIKSKLQDFLIKNQEKENNQVKKFVTIKDVKPREDNSKGSLTRMNKNITSANKYQSSSKGDSKIKKSFSPGSKGEKYIENGNNRITVHNISKLSKDPKLFEKSHKLLDIYSKIIK
jgi:hypothetical protein